MIHPLTLGRTNLFTIIYEQSLNLLNQETSFKRSTRQKAKRASMDVGYLLQVLQASIPLNSTHLTLNFSCVYPAPIFDYFLDH